MLFRSESAEIRKLRVELEPINEKSILSSELSSLVKKEYGVNIEVFEESDSSKYDPKNKAKMARPFKPALFIE